MRRITVVLAVSALLLAGLAGGGAATEVDSPVEWIEGGERTQVMCDAFDVTGEPCAVGHDDSDEEKGGTAR